MLRSFISPVLNCRSRVWRQGIAAALALCVWSAAAGGARADEFSPVPAGDPIYRQLSALDSADPTAVKVDGGLTRYEAALQVARVITRVSNDRQARLSLVGWRALRDLSGALQSELTQLGIDVAAAQKLAEAKIKEPVPSARVSIGASTNDDLRLNAPAGLGGAGRALPPRIARGAAGEALLGDALPGTTLLPSVAATFAPGVQSSEFYAPIMPRLRVGAALLALKRAEDDPFQRSGAGQTLLSAGSADRILGSNTSLDYNVNSWLSVRATSSQRSLSNVPDVSPFLRAPLFAGASETRSAGGGLGIDVGALSFSTKVERLSTDTGARGTSVDGGVRLSAWQNRLALSAHMARLQPDDRSVLESTRAELNVDVKFSNRLGLNLFYQGLFTQQGVGNSERVAGGLNLSF